MKQDDLFNRHFGDLVHEAAANERTETIGKYTPNLPLKREAEYCNISRNYERTMHLKNTEVLLLFWKNRS